MVESRMGRPPKPEAQVKRRGVAFRVTDALHCRLVAAAQTEGRSLAEQVTWMLETMLRDQDQRAMMREVVAEALDERDAKAADLRRKRALEAWNAQELAVLGEGRHRGEVRCMGPIIGGPDA